MKADKIIYEPHPVSPERKAQLRAEGYKILDAKFLPEGELENLAIPDVGAIAGDNKPDDAEVAEKDELIAALKELGVRRDRRTSVENLRDALAEAQGKAAE